MRRQSKVLVVAGALLIALAAVTRFVVLPAGSKLPGNLNATAHYSGTGTLLNAAALQAGDASKALARNIPIAADRHIYVSKIGGNTAIVHDDLTLNAPGGVKLPSDHTYAIDRTTMDTASTPAGVTGVQSHAGITITFPLNPKANDSYRYYEPVSELTTPVKFVGVGTVAGRGVYNYSTTASGPVRDAALLKTLPAALPKALAGDLAPLLPPDVAAKLAPALPSLPALVPLSYTVQTMVTVSADKATGLPLDSSVKQQVVANVVVGGQQVSLLPVLAINVKLTNASIKDAVKKAAAASKLLTLVGVVAPIGLSVVGIVLLVVGVVRRRKPAIDVPNTASRVTAAIT
jgi:hypothetical protein